jgi:hypothetical protein
MNTTAATTDVLGNDLDLASFVSRAWDEHARRPREVASALQARAPALSTDSSGADAIELAEHVWLGHLDDEAGLVSFLQALPATAVAAPETGASVQRARWVLAMLRGEAPPELADRARWRGMQNLWSVWSAQGQAAKALAMLKTEGPAALAHADTSARRGLAATCNNLAVELRMGRRGDPALDALMLALADGSRQLWTSAGTWVHVERAEYQLARCLAAIGDGAGALVHARACLKAIDDHAGEPQADAFERFFAHEALAWAHRTAGDHVAAAEQRAHMVRLLADISDAGLKSWGEEALAELDAA